MPAGMPKPANFIASLIAVLVIVGVFAFIYGLGMKLFSYNDMQFGLIAGFAFGAAGTVLAFLFGSSKSEERKTEALISPPDPPAGTIVTKTTTTASAIPPAREVWTAEERATRLAPEQKADAK